jgi:2-amino-4-hydroxy-6-hydroxymethyldihydropteridine diphosphokinase
MEALVRAFLGVGTNLGDRWGQLRAAVRGLRGSGRVVVLRASRVWDSEPLGPPQPRYLNAVLEVETRLAPRELLALLLRVERSANRRRDGVRWGARTLDLDLLIYGDRIVSEPGLSVPHPGIAARPFVLAPLAELAPALVIPGTGRSVAALLAELPGGSVQPAGLFPL